MGRNWQLHRVGDNLVSGIADILNPARTFKFPSGDVIKYREASLDDLMDSMRKGLVEEHPNISEKDLSKRVDKAMDTGQDIPEATIKHVLLAGLRRDNEGITLDDVGAIYTPRNIDVVTRLVLRIMGADDDDEAKAEGKKGKKAKAKQ